MKIVVVYILFKSRHTNITMALYHYGSISLWQYITMAVYHYGSISLWQYITMAVYHYGSISLWQYACIYYVTFVIGLATILSPFSFGQGFPLS